MSKRFKDWKRPQFDDKGYTNWGWRCQHPGNLKLGLYIDVGNYTYMNAKFDIIIGDHVQIGSHCSIYSVSTIDNKEGPVTLKKNCRVGTHSVVMPNVTIGENSIIGAFSFVTKDIPKNVVAFGVPAKVVRNLTEKEIKELEVSL